MRANHGRRKAMSKRPPSATRRSSSVTGRRTTTSACKQKVGSRSAHAVRGFAALPSDRVKVHHISFGGAVLERGFWLYIWLVTCDSREFLYVGRTGDSSSRFASSPFTRIGRHLDPKSHASANMLMRHIWKRGLDPHKCTYKLLAVGPIFPEQETLETHRKHRDVVAPLEAALADHLRKQGRDVCGRHSSRQPLDAKLFAQVLSKFRGLI